MGLVSAILITIVFLPFFYIAYLGKRQSKQRNKIFYREARKLGLHLDEQEQWGNTFLGLDRKRSKLIYMRDFPGELIRNVISLESISSCNVTIQQARQKTKGKVDFRLLKVDLELIHAAQPEKRTLLNFFDQEAVYAQDFETERAERWKERIRKMLHQPKAMRSAS